MATFYVLPSRHLLGQRFSELLAATFPGVRDTPWDWPDLAESLIENFRRMRARPASSATSMPFDDEQPVAADAPAADRLAAAAGRKVT